jgi:shikimate kinase
MGFALFALKNEAPAVAHIILTGFMGTGKTDAGRRLARAMSRAFVDTDNLVETAAGRTIPEIFAADGEARFRELERAAVRQAVAVPDAIIATGGGALLDPDSRRVLLAAGPVVCLTATPEEILRRIGGGADRPLLAARDESARLTKIRSLLATREPTYRMATYRVDTTGRTLDEVVAAVQALVGAE